MSSVPTIKGARPRNGAVRRVRRLLILAIALALFACYVGSYYYLSRRGMEEARVYNMKGFLYVPIEEACSQQDLSRHAARRQLYAPLNWVDQTLFGSDGPCGGMTWCLSK